MSPCLDTPSQTRPNGEVRALTRGGRIAVLHIYGNFCLWRKIVRLAQGADHFCQARPMATLGSTCIGDPSNQAQAFRRWMVIGLLAATLSHPAGAMTLSSGVIDKDHSFRFSGGPYIEQRAAGGQRCGHDAPLCDTYYFIAQGETAGTLAVTVGWPSDISDFSMPDIDLYLYDEMSGQLLGQAEGNANPETISLNLDSNVRRALRLEVVPRRPLGKRVIGTVMFRPAAANGGGRFAGLPAWLATFAVVCAMLLALGGERAFRRNHRSGA